RSARQDPCGANEPRESHISWMYSAHPSLTTRERSSETGNQAKSTAWVSSCAARERKASVEASPAGPMVTTVDPQGVEALVAICGSRPGAGPGRSSGMVNPASSSLLPPVSNQVPARSSSSVRNTVKWSTGAAPVASAYCCSTQVAGSSSSPPNSSSRPASVSATATSTWSVRLARSRPSSQGLTGSVGCQPVICPSPPSVTETVISYSAAASR